MANEKRGETTLTIAGKRRKFRLTAQACEELKELTGLSLIKLSNLIESGQLDDEMLIFALLYVGLHSEDENLEYDEFKRSIDMTDMAALGNQLNAIVGIAFPPADASGNADAGTEPPAMTSTSNPQ